MSPLRAHRVRALVSCLVDGVAVGAVLASRAVPPWSRRRVLTAAGCCGLLLLDQLTADLPRAQREQHLLGEVGAPTAEDRRVLLQAGARALVVGTALQLVDRPVREALARRGVAHPHRWMGVLAGVLQAATALPAHQRLAAERARRDAELDAAVEAELQAMASGG